MTNITLCLDRRPFQLRSVFLAGWLLLTSNYVLLHILPSHVPLSPQQDAPPISSLFSVNNDTEAVAGRTDGWKNITHSLIISNQSTPTKEPPPKTATSHILERMKRTENLQLSVLQQASFEAKRGDLSKIFPRERRTQVNAGEWAANIVTPKYAYLHIYKNGGTTVAAQTKHGHILLPKVSKYNWFTVVREPMDHFLSGWSECGDRDRKHLRIQLGLPPTGPLDENEPIPPNLLLDYDSRVSDWLMQVQATPMAKWNCTMHSFPQVNYMLNRRGDVFPQLQIVGDLRELPAVMQTVGFPYQETVQTGRNATADEYLSTYYPRRVDLLSNETMRNLCDYLAIDYFLLGYPLPPPCHDMPPRGYSIWKPNRRISADAQQLVIAKIKMRAELLKKRGNHSSEAAYK